jgi:hypothetical protein
MRVLKTALIALVTTCVVLPLAFMLRPAVLFRRSSTVFYVVNARTFLLEFLIVFAGMFVLTWLLLGRRSASTH